MAIGGKMRDGVTGGIRRITQRGGKKNYVAADESLGQLSEGTLFHESEAEGQAEEMKKNGMKIPFFGKRDSDQAAEPEVAGESASELEEEEKSKRRIPFFGKKDSDSEPEPEEAEKFEVEVEPVAGENDRKKAPFFGKKESESDPEPEEKEKKFPFFGKKEKEEEDSEEDEPEIDEVPIILEATLVEEEDEPAIDEVPFVLEATPVEERKDSDSREKQEEKAVVVEEEKAEKLEPQEVDDVVVEGVGSSRALIRSRGAAELIFGGAIAIVGLPLLVFPGPGIAAIVGGSALAAKGYFDFANKKDFSPEAKQLASGARTFTDETLVPASKQVAAGAKEFAQKDLLPVTQHAAQNAQKFATEKVLPAAFGLAGFATEKAKRVLKK